MTINVLLLIVILLVIAIALIFLMLSHNCITFNHIQKKLTVLKNVNVNIALVHISYETYYFDRPYT